MLCRLFFRFHVYGVDNVPAEGPLLIISNHQSFLDPVFCAVNVNRHLIFLARDTLFKHRFFGRLISSVSAMPVRRGQADIKTIKTVIEKLKQGGAICLFPEGTRSPDGRIAAFKPGFGLLCRRSGAAIVPAVIDGAFEAWPKHKKMASFGRKIVVCYGPVMPAEKVSKMNDRELAEQLTKTLRQMQNDCRLKHGKVPYVY